MPASRSDYYAVEDLLSAEERAVRDTVRRFVDDEYLPLAREHFANATFPTELTPRLAELGCFGPTVPTEYGGAGLNSVAYGVMTQELERGDSGLRSFASVQSSLVMYQFSPLDRRRRSGTGCRGSRAARRSAASA